MSDEAPFGEFQCAKCKGVFNRGQSVEAAHAEAVQKFGPMAKAAQDELCDDCYKEFMSWYETNSRNQ